MISLRRREEYLARQRLKDVLISWMAYKEAKALIESPSAPVDEPPLQAPSQIYQGLAELAPANAIQGSFLDNGTSSNGSNRSFVQFGFLISK